MGTDTIYAHLLFTFTMLWQFLDCMKSSWKENRQNSKYKIYNAPLILFYNNFVCYSVDPMFSEKYNFFSIAVSGGFALFWSSFDWAITLLLRNCQEYLHIVLIYRLTHYSSIKHFKNLFKCKLRLNVTKIKFDYYVKLVYGSFIY